ncbi:MAG: class I SAM-dependent methyltransferase [Pseudomonadales bacterium]|nr:class I SAM-dependent methyltransferase [Pseudomonadales bacterium]
MSRYDDVCHLCYAPEVATDQVALMAERLQLKALEVVNFRDYCRHHPESACVLWLDGEGLALREVRPDAPGPVRVDFREAGMTWRVQHGGGAGEMIARACGLRRQAGLTVLDATAGLARDAFLLASLGAQVLMCERSPLILALLEDGLSRAAVDTALTDVFGRMHLLSGDAISRMHQPDLPEIDVVYLDPMFPQREKSARVKKAMAAFQGLLGESDDGAFLLAPALQLARRRVVVKRPRLAACLGDIKPDEVISGKSSRFDLYFPKKRR